MSVQYETLLQQVLALPSKDRAALAKSVIDSLQDNELDDGDPAEIRAEWIEEIERRLAAVERGEMKLYSVEDVINELRRKSP